MLKSAGLKLQYWSSNDDQLTEKANSEGVGHRSRVIKVLGLNWNWEDDTLHLPNIQISAPCNSPTKRKVLRGISAVYDPLGFITPLTIPARILIQDIWKLKLDWDDALPLELTERWSGTSKTIEKAEISIRRPYLKKKRSQRPPCLRRCEPLSLWSRRLLE